MNPELGSFSDNCTVFEAMVRALDERRYEDARRQGDTLLRHIRHGHDEKSKRWLEAEVARHLDAAVSAVRTLSAAA
jgi:hypothetical protein